MIKGLKVMGIILGSGVLLIIVSGVLFLNLSPQFGGTPDEQDKQKYSASKQYKDGKFILTSPISTAENRWESLAKLFEEVPRQMPSKEIIPLSLDAASLSNRQADTAKVTWFGHSSFLVQMAGKTLLIDPMFGQHASPLPIGSFGKRFSKQLPIPVAQLPEIDFVVFSHDHYDHLDYPTVKALKHKVGRFFVPLGLGAHLKAWGVSNDKIEELDWWEATTYGPIQLVCTPAVHFSGRGLFDQAATLWASWVIKSGKESIFFSGDSGYGNHFKEIGERYGPFDIALMECGQYDPDWKNIHMFPEETAQAAIDVKSNLLVPIHWGCFKLANHTWTDPIERVTEKAKQLNMPLSTPRIGESILLKQQRYPISVWWQQY